MDINYKYAKLEYCKDLTDPHSTNIPVGIVGIGEIGGGRGFSIAITRYSGAAELEEFDNDPFTLSILNDFQNYLQEQLKSGIGEVGISMFLEWLQDRLRNTLHVSSIETHVLSLEENVEFQAQLVKDFIGLFREEILPVQEDQADGSPINSDMPYIHVQPINSQVHATPEQKVANA